MKRCTLDDLEFVKSVILHPDVYPWSADDLSPKADDSKVAEIMLGCSEIYVLSPNESTVLIFIPMNSVNYELHTNILPEGRGRKAISDVRLAGEWIIKNTPCLKVFTLVPAFNRAAAWMARKMGFVLEGVERKSFLKDGALHDQEIYGITKEEWLCR